MELLGFTVSGHPLDQFTGIAWDTYCRIADCSHHQVTGNQMKFITICDYIGIIECEIFAKTYRRFGLEPSATPSSKSKSASRRSTAASAALWKFYESASRGLIQHVSLPCEIHSEIERAKW